MSADNGHYVTELEDKPGRYGVFYYGASNPDEEYVEAKAITSYGSPTYTIIAALMRDDYIGTEYGVSVAHRTVLMAEQEFLDLQRGRQNGEFG